MLEALRRLPVNDAGLRRNLLGRRGELPDRMRLPNGSRRPFGQFRNSAGSARQRTGLGLARAGLQAGVQPRATLALGARLSTGARRRSGRLAARGRGSNHLILSRCFERLRSRARSACQRSRAFPSSPAGTADGRWPRPPPLSGKRGLHLGGRRTEWARRSRPGSRRDKLLQALDLQSQRVKPLGQPIKLCSNIRTAQPLLQPALAPINAFSELRRKPLLDILHSAAGSLTSLSDQASRVCFRTERRRCLSRGHGGVGSFG